MDTVFLNIDNKRKIFSLNPDESISCLFNEIDRLENIIRNYETNLKMISDTYNNKTFKNPDEV